MTWVWWPPDEDLLDYFYRSILAECSLIGIKVGIDVSYCVYCWTLLVATYFNYGGRKWNLLFFSESEWNMWVVITLVYIKIVILKLIYFFGNVKRSLLRKNYSILLLLFLTFLFYACTFIWPHNSVVLVIVQYKIM